jgi:group I intron endonuclease
MRKKLSGVYKIENILNGRVYIGSSLDLVSRERTHFSALKRNKHGTSHLQNSYNTYGKENFKFKILCYLDSNREILLIFERIFIQFYDATNRELGYNTKKEPSSLKGFHHSQESKDKIRNSLLALGKKGIKTGRVPSEETREKQRAKLKGKPAYFNVGRKRSAETIEKIRTNIISSGRVRGEKNPMSKLTNEQVIEIKYMMLNIQRKSGHIFLFSFSNFKFIPGGK